MSPPEVPNGVVIYGYSNSPYAQKVFKYLALAGIEYAQCKQPPVMPRADVSLLGVNYRRIPLVSIGGDVYLDTRIIIRKLNERFPQTKLASNPGREQAFVEKLVERWVTDSGVFARCAMLIPSELINDPYFLKDRTRMTGRTWTKDSIDKGRPEAITYVRDAFSILETTVLADGRQWLTNGSEPTISDIEAQFSLSWLYNMPGALPEDIFSEKTFPKTVAWIKRLDKMYKEKVKKPVAISGEQAKEYIMYAPKHDHIEGVDPRDPLGLRAGELVTIYPLDSGSTHKDTGRLVALNVDEVAIEIPETKIVVHAPRWGFRVQRANSSSM